MLDFAERDYGDNTGENTQVELNLDLAQPFLELLEHYRYKVFYGGRGSGKSWHMARALLILAVSSKKRILCCREFQTSIGESVHFILVDQIAKMGLSPWFVITDKSITCPTTGSEFIFKGLRLHIHEIKSLEAVDICWIEEGQAVSQYSWNTLDPTIRANNSEIWVSYNPLNQNDPVHDMFVIKGMPEMMDGEKYALVRKVNWQDNPWFPKDLDTLRRRQMNDNQDVYKHIWDGETLQISDAMIFKNKWKVQEFAAPEGTSFRFGADWGFSRDPTFLTRNFSKDGNLYIDYEAVGIGVDLDETAGLFAGTDQFGRWKNVRKFPGIPGAAAWPIKADNARPETISYLKKQGLNVRPAEKWKGSVEDGIEHIKAFNQVIIHPRCVNHIHEAMAYRFKVEPKTELVLPIIVDQHNHGWDATRYSLDGFIQSRGSRGMWKRLGRR